MKFIISLFLLCFLTVGVFAQRGATVSGTVTNLGQPVVEGEVTLTLMSNEAIIFVRKTDQNGKYLFEDIPNGIYKIFAKRNSGDKKKYGILAVGKNNVKLSAGQREIINIEMSITSATRTEIVNVDIASGTSQPISEVSKTVNFLDDQEITDRNEITLTDSLRTIPGFRVSQLGGFGRTASIKARGLRNQDTAILLDGIRFRDPASITGDASAFLSDFTTANIGRIEVLRGSGSSIYGTNAIGGVIDFQTPRPESDLNGSFVSEYGGFGLSRFRGDIGAGTADGKLAFTTGFSRTDVRNGIDGDDNADNTNLQGRIEYNPFSNTNISGRLYFSDAFVRLNSSPDTLGDIPSGQTIDAREGINFVADRNDPDNFQKSNFFSGQLALTQIINLKTIFSANYQGLKTKRENENNILGVGYQGFFNSIFDGQIHTFNTKLDWLPVENNRVTIGYEYEWEKFGNDGFYEDGSAQFSTNAKQASNTIYIQNLLGLFNNKLQLAGGFRFQKFSLTTPTFVNPTVIVPVFTSSNVVGANTNIPTRFANSSSPPNSYTFDGAGSYYFDKTKTKLRVHIGNGYRAPSLYERFGSFYFFGAFTFIGNPDLEPERSIGLDGGIDQSFYKDRLRLSATYFYTRIKNEIAYLPTDDLNGAAYYNADRRFSRGFETSAEAKPFDKTKIFASYTYTNSDERNFRRLIFLPPATLTSTDQRTFGIPDHQFTFVLTQRIGKRLILNFDFLATSNYLAPIFSNTTFTSVIYRFDGNRRGDLTGRYEIPVFKEKMKFVVFGTVENLFDNQYFENGFRTAGINGRFGVGMNF